MSTEDELFDDVRFWKARADAASARIEALEAALRPAPAPATDSEPVAHQIHAALTAAGLPYSGASWGEFNIFGNRKSVDEVTRLRSASPTPAPATVTDEMVETAWAAIVGKDVAGISHQADIIRADLKAGLEAALASPTPARTVGVEEITGAMHEHLYVFPNDRGHGEIDGIDDAARAILALIESASPTPALEEIAQALRAVIRDVNDFEQANKLAPNPGRTECWDSVARAKAILALIGKAGT
jgi:hypothetical protein